MGAEEGRRRRRWLMSRMLCGRGGGEGGGGRRIAIGRGARGRGMTRDWVTVSHMSQSHVTVGYDCDWILCPCPGLTPG